MRLLRLIVAVALAYTACGNAQNKEPKIEVLNNTMVKIIYYHDNGEIAQIGCFKNGKLEGEWVMFADSGKKIALGHYEKGKRNGEWFFWKVNGDALREVTYLDGKLINVVEWSNSKALAL